MTRDHSRCVAGIGKHQLTGTPASSIPMEQGHIEYGGMKLQASTVAEISKIRVIVK